MACYLVTGVAGFIGAALAKKLLSDGHQVIGIDNLSTGYEDKIPEGVAFYRGHCQDPDVIDRLPKEQYTAIFHIAGQSSGEVSFDDPISDLETNTTSTLNLLQFALSNGCQRFILAGTMSVYGDKPDRPVREDEELRPLSFYGVGKLASEHYLRIYEQYGIRSTSLRLFNVYGPGQNMKNLRQGMVSIFMAQMLEDRKIHVKGGLDRFRDFVYIDDVTDAFLACLDHPESAGQALNIGTGIRTTVDTLLKKLIALYPKDVNYISEGSTPGDMLGIYADIDKARTLIAYDPKYSLESGLKKMLLWATGTQEKQ
jgi:UDP-glucose 4-epimerase